MVTKEQLAKIYGRKAELYNDLIEPLSKALEKYQINTKLRIAMFLAQVGEESAGLTVRKENLNYSAEGLLKTFGKYFNAATAAQYARKPEKIANRVYANRMGNGSEASGDGWKHRGLGYIQLTGKNNQSDYAKYIGKSLDETIAYLDTVEGAIDSACWFCVTRGILPEADKGNVKGATIKVNGGTNGLEGRTKYYNNALKVL